VPTTVTPELQQLADENNRETVSVYQAAHLTGLSHMTVRRRIKQQRIRAVRIGASWRIWTIDLAGLR
jgi:excisionase family DNA binding protein